VLPRPDVQASLSNAENTIAVLNMTADGRFAGAVMPMVNPLDSKSQWRGLVDGLFCHIVAKDSEAELDGLYAFTWWSDPSEPEHSGLLLTRLTDEGFDVDYIPQDSSLIGLVLVARDERLNGYRSATLALRSYVSKDGVYRPDRILATVIDDAGVVRRELLDRDSKRSLHLVGRALLRLNDSLG